MLTEPLRINDTMSSNSSSSSPLAYTSIPDIGKRINAARQAFNSGKTKNMEWRCAQIRQIKKLMEENTDRIVTALSSDLHRPELEGVVAECHTVTAEAREALQNIHSWVQPVKVDTPPLLLPGSSYIQYEPLGVVLIIAPWNFPIQLCLNPAIAAIAAGNAVVLKPSEVSPASAKLIEELVRTYLDTDAIQIVQGAVEESTELLRHRFDHILYTGNDKVAKIVMKAAAEYLTPVTLELGGKSPAIVDASANLDLAAEHIISSKCVNAGQICIAPDYVLVDRSIEDKLLSKMKETIKKFYGDNPSTSADYGRIVNKNHFNRVKRLLDTSGGTIAHGGDVNEKDLYIAPTLITNAKSDSNVLTEEIFGPLLPIVPISDLDDAIQYINKKEKPLALYIFSSSSKNQKKILSSTTSGGVCINECLLHNINPHLPFGGVGNSGMGAYHGKWGFETFSHRRGIFHQATFPDTGPIRYPPYSKRQLKLIDFLSNNAPALPNLPIKNILILGLSVAVALLSAKLAGKF